MSKQHLKGWIVAGAFAGLLCAGCNSRGSTGTASTVGSEAKLAVSLPTAALTFPDGKTITVEIAMTPHDREYGLMNRTSLSEDYGMLFVFPKEQGMQFWMKNTFVNLDMIFIGKDRRINEVFEEVPRSAPDTPEVNLARRGGIAQYVLELPSGAAERHRLKKSQQFRFSVPIPSS